MRRVYNIALVLLLACCQHPVPVGAAQEFVSVARDVEQQYALPTGLLESVCYIESHWKGGYGRNGEIGVCQIKPSTVKMICPECYKQREHLSIGAVSDRVLEIQDVLHSRGLYTSTLDGIFGKRTHAAVLAFQKESGLQQDGVVGPRTWNALFGTTQPYASVIEQLKDPLMNIQYAGMFLAWLRDYLSTEDASILAAAYNGGPAHPVVQYMLKVSRLTAKNNEEREIQDLIVLEDFNYDHWRNL